jgi:hypothetical protein
VFFGCLNEIADAPWVIGVTGVEDLHLGVKKGDDQELAVVGNIDTPEPFGAAADALRNRGSV